MTYQEKVDWIIEQHRNTNHKYADYLPYEFHLQLTVNESIKWSKELYGKEIEKLTLACWGHDLIEDTRVTYNDVRSKLGEEVADIIYAVTNEKGKTRKERSNDKYYEGIRNTDDATFVKLCDRISNIKYGILVNSRMVSMYRKEHDNFVQKLYDKKYEKMFTYLKNLLEE